MLCKHCNVNESQKYSKYTSGEYCSRKCSRAFSTKEKRQEINQKVSYTVRTNPNSSGFKTIDPRRDLAIKARKVKFESKPRVEVSCKFCEKMYVPKDARNKGGFCSRDCLNLYNKAHPEEVLARNLKSKATSMKNRRAKWDQLPFEQRPGGYQRELIFEEQDGKCLHCGLNEWLGRSMPLEMDHIDGNRSNNKRENLRLLCPNCHALTPTYKGRNVDRQASPVTDDQILQSLVSTGGSVHKALLNLNLCPGAGNWQRAKRLLLELKPQVSV